MPQHAWLDFHGGYWHLVTANRRHRDRKWTNRYVALADLKAEGWTIDESYGEQPTMKHDSSRHMYGYGLIRTVH
jgi:hypothetical protein